MTMQVLLFATDHVLEVSGLSNGLTGALIANATVTVTLVDATGEGVEGVTWPLSVPAVTGVAGTYRVVLPAAMQVSPRSQLEARIIADAGAGLRRSWFVPLRVERQACSA
jgi:hypothetical protein